MLFLVRVLARLRWDESTDLPLRKVSGHVAPRVAVCLTAAQILLLFWKSILLLFGGSSRLVEIKAATQVQPSCSDEETSRRITASPLRMTASNRSSARSRRWPASAART